MSKDEDADREAETEQSAPTADEPVNPYYDPRKWWVNPYDDDDPDDLARIMWWGIACEWRDSAPAFVRTAMFSPFEGIEIKGTEELAYLVHEEVNDWDYVRKPMLLIEEEIHRNFGWLPPDSEEEEE